MLVLLASCTRGGTSEKSSSDEAPAAPQEAPSTECGPAIEADVLSRCAAQQFGDPLLAAPPATWATQAAQPPIDALLIEVSPGKVSVERYPVALPSSGDAPDPAAPAEAAPAEAAPADEPREPGESIDEALDKAWQINPEGQWALVIDGAVPRSEVAFILGELDRADHHTGYVLLARGDKVTAVDEPPDFLALRTEIQKVIANTPADQRAKTLRAEIDKRSPECISADELALKTMEQPEHRVCRMLARELGERFAKCGCPKESGPLAAMMVAGLESKIPRVAAPAKIDKTAPPREGTTWAEIVAGMEEADLAKLWVDAG